MGDPFSQIDWRSRMLDSESINSIKAAVAHLGGASSLAVITGAGISAESGIPTFRGEGGLWRNFRAEDLATPEAFRRDPKLVWEWYDWRRQICARALPNAAHQALVLLESRMPSFLLITQNVDGLHERSGSKRILEIHGNIWRARCTACKTKFEISETPLSSSPVLCPNCGSLARPHIVWFGESYDESLIQEAVSFLRQCDVLLVIGTSGMVSMPGFLTEQAFRARRIELNPERSGITPLVQVSIRAKAAEAMPLLLERLNAG